VIDWDSLKKKRNKARCVCVCVCVCQRVDQYQKKYQVFIRHNQSHRTLFKEDEEFIMMNETLRVYLGRAVLATFAKGVLLAVLGGQYSFSA
jgi:hypothetical protein